MREVIPLHEELQGNEHMYASKRASTLGDSDYRGVRRNSPSLLALFMGDVI